MNQDTGRSGVLGTITVLDLMLLVAASSVSILLIKMLLPPLPTTNDYLLLTAYCGPAGLAVFGPWAVRRQFIDSSREELEAGEWLWVALAGGWLAATPLIVVTGGRGVAFFAGLMAAGGAVAGIVAAIQSLSNPRHRPWTHWAGIALCLLHAGPALIGIGPLIWSVLEAILETIF